MNMTDQRVIDILQTEKACVYRNKIGACDRNCQGCYLVLKDDEILCAYDMAIKAIKTLRGDFK